MTTRAEVYAAIDGERDYQDALGTDRVERPNGERVTHTTAEYLTMLRSYMNKADAAWTDNPGDTEALKVVRKIAGIAVHCMEDNGAIPR